MKSRIIQIFLGLVAIAAAVFGASYWQKNYLAGITMSKIPVPQADIPPYTLLTAEMFTEQEYPRALVDQGAYLLSTADLEGSISVETLLAGLPVAKRMAVPPDQFRLANSSLEVISLPAEATMAVGGQVHIGEMVNIYCLIPAPEQTDENAPPPKPEVAFVARVPVVAVLADGGQPLVSTSTQDSQENGPKPMEILLVAAPSETVRAILNAIALVQHEGAFLWVTLATP
jgi:Flp pilus assembly protein CpaB